MLIQNAKSLGLERSLVAELQTLLYEIRNKKSNRKYFKEKILLN